MLENDLDDELRGEQNNICDILGDELFEIWHKSDGLKKFVLYQKIRDLFLRELRNFKVNKGFVLSNNTLSPHIDIIIYQGNELNQNRNDEFVIVRAEQVQAIIKLIGTFKMKKCKIQAYIDALCKLKRNINTNIFTGICAYHFEEELTGGDFRELFAKMKENVEPIMQTKFINSNNFINSVSLGKDWLMRFWGKGIKYDYACYEIYNVVDYGFDYLILNLKEYLGLADDTAYQRDGFSGGKDSVQLNKIIFERTYDETRCNTN